LGERSVVEKRAEGMHDGQEERRIVQLCNRGRRTCHPIFSCDAVAGSSTPIRLNFDQTVEKTHGTTMRSGAHERLTVRGALRFFE